MRRAMSITFRSDPPLVWRCRVKIGNIVFDCSDPDRVASFWAAALGYEKGKYPPEMRQELMEAGLTEAEYDAASILLQSKQW